jgi:hypothetical protein
LELFDNTDFQILVPLCPHCTPQGSGDVLDSVQLTYVIVSDILDSDHLPFIFHILDHVRSRDFSNCAKEFTDWEQFQSLASELISLVKDFS